MSISGHQYHSLALGRSAAVISGKHLACRAIRSFDVLSRVAEAVAEFAVPEIDFVFGL